MIFTFLFDKCRVLLAAFAAAPLLAGCGSGPIEPPPGSGDLNAEAKPVAEAYATLVHASYTASLSGAEDLRAALDALVMTPTQANLDAARAAWLAAREPYGQTEAYRFYSGPIDDADGPEGRINAWPMDEAYVDYVEGDPNAGIINDPMAYPEINPALLGELNEQGGEENIASGYHAIEFLLWGQDLSPMGPGARPFTDYVTDGSGTAANQDRRGAFLMAASELLLTDLQELVDAWDPGVESYRASFVALPGAEALKNILLGMGSLSGAELAGERMQTAYDTKEQEDEHSCFSDNTHNDLIYNALSIQNVYLGRFGAEDGPGLDEIVRARDAALDARMQEQLQASVEALQAIPPPFDQAIQGDDDAEGRARVSAAIEALRAQTQTIVDIAALLQIQLNLEE
jgi:putative iron-regulated protein